MKRLIPLVATVAMAWPVLAGAATRTLSHSQPAAGVETLELDSGVGEVTVLGTDGDQILVEVELRPRRSGIFFSSRRAEREIQDLEINVEQHGAVLRLRIDGADRDDRDYSEDWSIRIPERLGFTLDAGVGDVRIERVGGPVSLDAGVGDIRVVDPGGDVIIDAGVGDIVVEGDWGTVGRVSASCGVGDASLRTPEGRSSGTGFIGKDVKAKGPGSSTIEVDAGVGDVTICLR